jgi:hypothetical protein
MAAQHADAGAANRYPIVAPVSAHPGGGDGLWITVKPERKSRASRPFSSA